MTTPTSLNKFLKVTAALILIASTGLAGYGTYFFKNKAEVNQEEQIAYNNNQARLEYLKNVERKYNEDLKQEEKLYEALPNSAEISEFLLSLSSLADANNVKISSINFPGASKGDGNASIFQSKLSLSSVDLKALENLIREIEENRRLIDITELIITQSDAGSYQAAMGIKTYYKK